MAAEIGSDSSIQLLAHPPERNRTRSIAPVAAGPCCCCCCCLHSIGGLFGAAVGSVAWSKSYRADPYEGLGSDFDEVPEADAGGTRGKEVNDGWAASAFWVILGNVGLWGVLICTFFGGNAVLAAFFIVIMAFPALQIVAAIIALAAILMKFWMNRSERNSRAKLKMELYRLSKITLGVILGAATGGGIMVFLFKDLGPND